MKPIFPVSFLTALLTITFVWSVLVTSAPAVAATISTSPPAESKDKDKNKDAAKEETDFSQEFAECLNKLTEAEDAKVKCVLAETKRQEVRMDRAYKQATATLEPRPKARFQEAQRQWVKYRDAQCSFYALLYVGVQGSAEAADCALTATTERAAELEKMRDL
ncbi:exported hypothetical protein [Gammaproteobacteria bacterium]